jgi:hypothetical protein
LPPRQEYLPVWTPLFDVDEVSASMIATSGMRYCFPLLEEADLARDLLDAEVVNVDGANRVVQSSSRSRRTRSGTIASWVSIVL